jgi:hypothetical protein
MRPIKHNRNYIHLSGLDKKLLQSKYILSGESTPPMKISDSEQPRTGSLARPTNTECDQNDTCKTASE